MERFVLTIGLAILLVILCAYAIHMMMQKNGTTENYTELSPADYPPKNSYNPGYYQPELGILTAASDFIGLPSQVLPAWSDEANTPAFNQMMGNAGLGFNLCSKSCCSPQWAPPFSTPQDDLVANSGQKFVGTSYGCTNTWQDSGCLCMSEEQGAYLDSRGGNK